MDLNPKNMHTYGHTYISEKWRKDILWILKLYLGEGEGKRIIKNELLRHFEELKGKVSQNTLRKAMILWRAFLKWKGVDWLDSLKLLSEITPAPVIIQKEHVQELIFRIFKRSKRKLFHFSIVLLLATSGLRPKELCKLSKENIYLENRFVYVPPGKTGKGKIAIFNWEAQIMLKLYLPQADEKPFSYEGVRKMFRRYGKGILPGNKDLKAKHLRKFFSQEWDRLGGPTSVKKLLMGHSLKRDIDLAHYGFHTPEELRKIYDMVEIEILGLKLWNLVEKSKNFNFFLINTVLRDKKAALL